MNTAMLPLSIKNMSFFRGQDAVLNCVNLDVCNGEFLAIIGPNGGGKTTLLRLILGMLEADQGSITVFGKKPQAARSLVGYVPQYSTLKVSFPASVLEMVMMGSARPSLLGGRWSRGKKDKDKAMELLAFLDLADKAKKSIAALSGGQRQRALIARALMGRPEDPNAPFLLLLDEPTASIDPAGKHCFYNFLEQLRGDVTIIVVSHELLLASLFFTNVAFINKTLTRLPENKLTLESLTTLFGEHQHACPVGNLQHASGVRHNYGCTHESCATVPAEQQLKPINPVLDRQRSSHQ